MNEKLKLFGSMLSKEPELVEKFRGIEDRDELFEAGIAAAAAMGIELTREDFVPAEPLSEDELAAVAGGAEDKRCSCIVGGGGAEDSWDDTCACVLFGYSDSTMCMLIGVE